MQKRNTLNKRQQLFCHYLTEGDSQAQSYLKAGFKANTIQQAGSNAIRLMRTERVSSYLAKLKEVQFTKQALTYAEKRSFIARSIRTPVGELHEGSDLTQEVTIIEGKEGMTKRIKALDKARLLEIDNRMAGHDFKDRQPQASNPFLLIVSLGKTQGVTEMKDAGNPVRLDDKPRAEPSVIDAELVG